MYGNLKIENYKAILRRIKDNHSGSDGWVTHKKIRVYIECMRDLWDELSLPCNAENYLPEIEFLMRAMSCRISHEKRAFLAEMLLERLRLLEEMLKREDAQNPSNF